MEALQPIMQDFLQRGLVISPWLAGVGENGRFGDQVFVYLDQECKEFASLQWTDEGIIEMFGDIPTVYDRHRIRKHAGARLLPADAGNALLAWHWHRPWVDYSLNDEEILGVMLGLYQLKTVDGKRYVSLTETGWQRYREIESFLNETGYLAHRIRLLHLTGFNLFKDFTRVVKEFTPEWIPRRDFLDWIGIEPGMHVLELGCADGLFTFEGGLAKRVGSSGRVVAFDPSRGMLTQAKQKSGRRRMTWVEFVQGKAEELPFENDTFDAAVGVAFLHFTDKASALAEMVRVVKPGGMIASFHPLPFCLEAPFFRDWFEPLLEIARKNGRAAPKNHLSTADAMTGHFEEAGLQNVASVELTSKMLFGDADKNVDAIVNGVGWSQEELATLPWKAREDLIAEL